MYQLESNLESTNFAVQLRSDFFFLYKIEVNL
jgi:hypothetical protein